MDQPAFEQLLTAAGQQALRQAEEYLLANEDELRLLALLRRGGADARLARAAVETALLRRQAETKFANAGRMYFTREALEQSSSPACSAHRAARFRGRPMATDVGCGIGGDSIALAEAVPLLALDRDRLRLRMARENVAACVPDAAIRFVLANAEDCVPALRFPTGAAMFCDPSRRVEGRRVFSVRAYSPSLARIDSWRANMPDVSVCVKASPGIHMEEIADSECEVEFLSVAGELKEAVLWYGDFRIARRRATRLPGGTTLTDSEPESDAISAPQEYLYEPDPSILRAGLVRQLAARLSAARIDPQIAYLTSAAYQPTPWARAFRLEETMPFGLKRLREWLRKRNIGQVTVKKRGSPLVPEELEQQLRLRGDGERILFLTKVAGRPYVLIAEEEIARS